MAVVRRTSLRWRRPEERLRRGRTNLPKFLRSGSAEYLVSVLAVALATVGTVLIYQWIEPSISLLFFPAVVVAGIYGGYGPALVATVASTFSLAYFFVPPRYSFDIGVDDVARLAVFVGIAVLTTSISQKRKQAEAALGEQLRAAAVREDRLRVGRDLHDGILQALTGIRLELQAVADEVGPARDRLLALERALALEQRELRLLIDALKPSGGTAHSFGSVAERLQEMCARLSAEWRTPVSGVVMPNELTLPDATQQVVRLMVHEAVVNALKHAHPSRVAVHVEADGRWLKILVSDDGRGFSFRGRLDHDMLAAANTGPVSLRERVAAIGGRMAIESTASGSRLEITMPAA